VIARELFHGRGYDAVSVADLTEALDVKPPSLYAAYGSKLGLFERALSSYVSTQFLPVDDILAKGGDPASALTDLFVAAAKHYTRDTAPRGCLVTEAMRSDDADAAGRASAFAEQGIGIIREYVARFASSEDTDRIVDYVLLNLRGLSSYACLGYSGEKLVSCAMLAGRVLEGEFALASDASAEPSPMGDVR
jgi:TetR/AcrR family transcriptional repressor for divergent bdcA